MLLSDEIRFNIPLDTLQVISKMATKAVTCTDTTKINSKNQTN